MTHVPPTGNQRGITLLYLAILLALLGVLAATGIRALGSVLTRAKVNQTRMVLERTAAAITAWGARNGRLPDSAEFAATFGASSLDAWNRALVYAYDATMSQPAGGGLCGRTSTAISDGGRQLAFVLVSGGSDHAVSTPGASGAFSGDLTGLGGGSVSRGVTLKELQESAGCLGSLPGRLRIVNNELPDLCRGRNYSVTLFGEGGVPPLSFAFAGLPAGLSVSGAVISGNSNSPAGTYSVVVTATDSQLPAASTVQRSYVFKVMSSCR